MLHIGQQLVQDILCFDLQISRGCSVAAAVPFLAKNILVKNNFHIARRLEQRAEYRGRTDLGAELFFQQRRRWQIGMIQSMSRHGYMLANHHYGWAGILAGSVFLLYEMFAPFLEILGGCTLITAFLYGILDVFAVAMIMLCYFVLMLVMENLLIAFLKVYEVEPLSLKKQLSLAAISGVEFFTFHIINSVIKITAMLTYRKHGKTWRHIARTYEPLS